MGSGLAPIRTVDDPARRRADERGSAALTSVAAMGMFLVMLTILVQFAAWQYGRGVLRSAALEGARAGSAFGVPAGLCERRFDEIRGDLLGGSMGDGVGPATCAVADDRVTVSVDARFEAWLPVMPGWSFTVTAVSTREVAPQ